MIGVSIIICCYNSSSRIKPTLTHLAKQNINENVEIIFVDNNSTDNTLIIAKEIWQNLNTDVPIIFLEEKRKGKTFAFNKGLEYSKYDFILICDDDNWLSENYVQKALSIISSNNKIGAIGGLGIPEYEEKPPEWFISQIGGYAVGPQGESSGNISSKGWLYGAGMVLRKSALLELYSLGFKNYLTGHVGNTLLSGEDAEICYAMVIIGYEIWYEEELIFKHFTSKERLTWQYSLRVFEGYGAANVVLTNYKLAIQNRNRIYIKNLWIREILRLLKNTGFMVFLIDYFIFKNSIKHEYLLKAKLWGELKALFFHRGLFIKNKADVFNLIKPTMK